MGTITICEELAKKFLEKYFPLNKTTKLRNNITTFILWENKSLYEMWKCYKDLLRKCPHHNLSIWLQIQTFYNSLNATSQSIIDVTVGKALMSKTCKAAYGLLKKLELNNYQQSSKRAKLEYVTEMINLIK